MYKVLMLFVLFASTHTLAQANPYRYNSIGVSYENAKVDGVSDRADGFSFSGELKINPIFLVSAGYGSYKLSGFDINATSIGVDYVHPLQPGADFLFGFSQTNTEISGSIGEDTDASVATNLGLRFRINEHVQSRFKISSSEGEEGLSFDLQMFVNPVLGIMFGTEQSKDVNSTFFGFRYYGL